MGALIALYARGETGRGQHVDVSAMDSVVQNGLEAIPDWVLAGREWKRPGQTHVMMKGLVSPIIWECKDGYISYMFIGGLTGAKANQRLIEWMASEGMAPDFLVKTDWEKFDMAKQDQADLDAIHSAFGSFFKTHTKSEIQEGAIRRKIMMYPTCNAEETLRNQQLAARDFWVKIRHEDLSDTITYPGAFAKFSETGIKQWRGAPRIGEHNEEIFVRELGYSQKDLDTMRQAGVI
jgi:crotonobetainyl-CoA:carnitine CoA-transferase CaiB-like acyl-CoA transferase